MAQATAGIVRCLTTNTPMLPDFLYKSWYPERTHVAPIAMIEEWECLAPLP